MGSRTQLGGQTGMMPAVKRRLLMMRARLMVQLAECNDHSSDSSSSSSSSSSELDEDLQEASSLRDLGKHMDSSCLLYRQGGGRAVHLFPRTITEGRFVCGRAKTADHKPLHSMVLTAEWVCKQCKVGRPVRDKGSPIEALNRRIKQLRKE